MNFYETVFILDAAPDAIDAEIQKVVDLIAANKGKMVSVDRWGMRKLAYEIKRKGQGYYTCVYFNGDESLPARLENYYKLNESCLRYLTVVSIHTPEEIAARGERARAEVRPSERPARVPRPAERKAEEVKATPETQKPREAPTEAKATEPPADKPAEKPAEAEATEEVAEKPEAAPVEAEAFEQKPEAPEQTAPKTAPEGAELEEKAVEEKDTEKTTEEKTPHQVDQ